MGRMMPQECKHGTILDWGDFGPSGNDPDYAHLDELPSCPKCEKDRLTVWTDAGLPEWLAKRLRDNYHGAVVEMWDVLAATMRKVREQ